MINTVFSFQYRHGGDLFTMNNLKLLSGYSILYLTACMVLLDLVANAMASYIYILFEKMKPKIQLQTERRRSFI